MLYEPVSVSLYDTYHWYHITDGVVVVGSALSYMPHSQANIAPHKIQSMAKLNNHYDWCINIHIEKISWNLDLLVEYLSIVSYTVNNKVV